ncbi:MAG: Holliday junction resolvase RuvX, partial [Synergistales bacterium]|nr:Holliday junction resolvase RuvX [Synergistales bacterium]
FAQGVAVLSMRGEWRDELDALVERYHPSVLLVGLPLRTGGEEGPEARSARQLARQLGERYPQSAVEMWDERFTSTVANQSLLAGDVSRKQRKKRVDMVAATILLQSYLEYHGGNDL